MEKPTELQEAKKRKEAKQGGNGKDPGAPGPVVAEMSMDEFAKQAGADKVEVVTNDEVKQRLGDLLAGKAKPPNEFVAYLVGQLRAGNNEFRQVQQAIQEENQKLAQLQKRAIQLQGEQNKYVQDIMAWMDRDLTKPAGDEPGKEETDA